MKEYGLGRIFAPDPNDSLYRISALTTADSTRQIRYWWDSNWWGDQLDTSRCVEFAFHHWLNAGPIRPSLLAPYWEIGSVYSEAQRVDEWDGEDYEGTSVRAGAKVLQARGYIQSYLWGWSFADLLNAVLDIGPVVVGTNWYSNMFTPDSEGKIRVGGSLEGGHAYLVSGVSRRRELVRIKNSWSREWGKRGRAYLSFDDMERLISEEGEVCLAIELRGG